MKQPARDTRIIIPLNIPNTRSRPSNLEFKNRYTEKKEVSANFYNDIYLDLISKDIVDSKSNHKQEYIDIFSRITKKNLTKKIFENISEYAHEKILITSVTKQLFLDFLEKPNISIEHNNVIISVLPTDYEDLSQAITRSKYMLEMKYDWDDEGAEGYTNEVWVNAIGFICDFALWKTNNYRHIIATPKIHHGPEGSIDFLWKNDEHTFLLNFPASSDEPATFYGETVNSQIVEGTFNPSNYNKKLLPIPVQ